ncbi:MAG: hypothetical protein EA376_12920 [Phycisphaeraceae bacterium]|nr:MAG: hypothetical protein EA376_12920 [Phycisphaeraceae bacterium]
MKSKQETSSRRPSLWILLWPFTPLRKRAKGEGEHIAGEALLWTGVAIILVVLLTPSYDNWWVFDRSLLVISVLFICFSVYLLREGRRKMREAERARLEAEEMRRG